MSDNCKQLIGLSEFDESQYTNVEKAPNGKELESKSIWKYMSLEHALDLVQKQRLWMANPATWADPFERLFVEATYKKEEREEGISFNDLLDGKQLYCTCFTSGSQNDAQWKMYCGNDMAVMIGFDARKLFDALREYKNLTLYIGEAQYEKGGWNQIRPFCELTAEQTAEERRKELLSLMLRKRINFEYEKELRLMCLQKLRKDNPEPQGIYITVPHLRDCIKRIRLEPHLGTNTVKALRYIFQQAIQNGAIPTAEKGGGVSINRSRLFEKVTADIRIPADVYDNLKDKSNKSKRK